MGLSSATVWHICEVGQPLPRMWSQSAPRAAFAQAATCEVCGRHVHQYHESCWRHTTLLDMQYNDNATWWHNMTWQHNTCEVSQVCIKQNIYANVMQNWQGYPTWWPTVLLSRETCLSSLFMRRLAAARAAQAKLTLENLGHWHTRVFRGTNTQTHTSATVWQRSFKTPHQSCIALVWDHGWAQGKGRAEGQGWRAEAQRERQSGEHCIPWGTDCPWQMQQLWCGFSLPNCLCLKMPDRTCGFAAL